MTKRGGGWKWLVAGVCAAAIGGCGNSAADAGSGSAGTATIASAPAAVARVHAGDWPTFDFNPQRTGVGPADSGITGRNVRGLRLRVVNLNGIVDASAIELHAVRVGRRRHDAVFLTTTYGRTIAIDPGTGQRLWEYTPRDLGTYSGSARVTDTTPVADPDRRFIYAVSPDGIVHKLAVASGHEVRSAHWPVRITFDPAREKMDSPLGISGSAVIATTGGYIGDAPSYQGHVVLIDRASGRITHVFNTLCSDNHGLIDPPRACPHSDSAIWGRAGVVVEPGSGRLLLATGNGNFDGRIDWGDSVLELSPGLRLLHNWTPPNQAQLDAGDTDLGSSSPVLLPVLGGRRLVVQGGKDQRLHLLDLDRLNGTPGGAGPRVGGELQALATPGDGELFSAPAVWAHAGRAYLFVADGSGTAAYAVSGGAHPHMSVVWQNPASGTSPVLAGGLLYVYDESNGTLDVYAPISGARVATLRAATGHWNSPIVVGGRIILPVGSYHSGAGGGQLYIWHR
jgi:outer membrane protein assembly factor BamB